MLGTQEIICIVVFLLLGALGFLGFVYVILKMIKKIFFLKKIFQNFSDEMGEFNIG